MKIRVIDTGSPIYVLSAKDKGGAHGTIALPLDWEAVEYAKKKIPPKALEEAVREALMGLEIEVSA